MWAGRPRRALAATYRALAQSLTGDGESAVALLERLVDDARAEEGPYLGVFLAAMGLVRLHAKRMDAVEAVARRMLDAPGRRPLADYWQGYALFFRAAAAYERNRLPEAEAAFRRIRDLRHRVSARVYLDALVGLCLVARARSDASGLERAAADARAWALEVGDGESLRIAESLEARLGLDAPEGEARAATPPVVPDFTSHWLEVPSLTYAEQLLRDPSPESREAALPFIDAALERAEAHHNVRQSVPLEALLSACDGDHPGDGRSAPASAGPADGADQAPSDVWKLLSRSETIPAFAFVLGYTHKWNARFASNVSYAYGRGLRRRNSRAWFVPRTECLGHRASADSQLFSDDFLGHSQPPQVARPPGDLHVDRSRHGLNQGHRHGHLGRGSNPLRAGPPTCRSAPRSGVGETRSPTPAGSGVDFTCQLT